MTQARRSYSHPHPHAFTLVEMAVVLVIMGLMAALIFPGIFRAIERNMLERERNAVTALKNEVVGYVVTHRQLPANLSPFSGRINQWDRDVVYYQGLSGVPDICVPTTTNLRIRKTATGTARDNIAFVLVSSGKNMNQETGHTSGPPQIVTYYDQGVTAPAFPGFEYDDIVEYVSLMELKGKACRTTESGKTPPGNPAAHIDFKTFANTAAMLAHPSIDAPNVGSGATIATEDGMQVLRLDGTANAFVRLRSMVSANSDEFCEYTIMGWVKTATGNTGLTFDPIINRQGADYRNRNFWVTLWQQGAPGWTGQPLVHRSSHAGSGGYFNLAVGDGPHVPPTLPFRDNEWHFFAVNMNAAGVAGKGASPSTCTVGGPYTCTLYGSVAGPTLLVRSQQQPQGPDVGVGPNDYPVEIGRERFGRFFNGFLSEIVIYKRGETLSDDQIRAWYDATKVDYP